jgi:hypothetical protein
MTNYKTRGIHTAIQPCSHAVMQHNASQSPNPPFPHFHISPFHLLDIFRNLFIDDFRGVLILGQHRANVPKLC